MIRRFFAALTSPARIPVLFVAFLAASALIGNGAQWAERNSLREANATYNADAECRSRIVGYVEGLSIELDIAEAMGLLDQVGADDLPVGFDEAVSRATAAAVRLEVAKRYRENAVDVCAADPEFDPANDIPAQ